MLRLCYLLEWLFRILSSYYYPFETGIQDVADDALGGLEVNGETCQT